VNIKRINFKPDLSLAIVQRRKRVTRRLARLGREHETDPWGPLPDCHVGEPGDLLWVPERWRVQSGQVLVQYPGKVLEVRWTSRVWLSARSMPRWASRIWLSIVSTRQENLTAITEAEAVLEGFTASPGTGPNGSDVSARDLFIAKWEAIYDRSTRVADVAWKDDPVVWRVEFDPIEVDEARKRIAAAGLKL